jgi:hypothetical protein
MKRTNGFIFGILFFCFSGFFPLLTFAAETDPAPVSIFGVGIRSDGLGLDLRIADELALTSALRFTIGKVSTISGHINALYFPEAWEIVSEDLGRFPLYAGIGVILGGIQGLLLGMRFPFGVAHHLQGTPLQVFLEFSPYFHFIQMGRGEVTFSSGEGSFGVIYFF